jgi:uncharacterized membrane protein
MARRKSTEFGLRSLDLFFTFIVVLVILCVFIGFIYAALSDFIFGLSLLGGILLFGWLLKIIGVINSDYKMVKVTEEITDRVLSGLKGLLRK